MQATPKAPHHHPPKPASLDYYAHARDTRALLERLAGEQPVTLACMRGSAWTGDGAALLRTLADRLGV